jgi:hypothetical protein
MNIDLASLWILIGAVLSVGLLFAKTLRLTAITVWSIGTCFSIAFALSGSYFLALLEFVVTTLFTLIMFNFGLTMGELQKAHASWPLLSVKTVVRWLCAGWFGYLVYWCVEVFSLPIKSESQPKWSAEILTQHFFGTHGLTLLFVLFGLSFIGLGVATVSRVEK